MDVRHNSFIPYKTKNFIESDTTLRVGDGFYIEWKPGPGEAPVRAETINLDGRSALHIKTTQEKGWVRLHLILGEDLNAVLGFRFKIKVATKTATSAVKPILTHTNPRRGSRYGFKTAPSRKLSLRSHFWYDILGAYRVTPLADGHRLDMVVDVPRGAEIWVSDVTLDELGPPLSQPDTTLTMGEEVWPLAEFAARPFPTDHLASSEDLPVYSTDISLTATKLRGRILTNAEALYWDETGSDRKGVIELRPAEQSEDCSGKVIEADFQPPLSANTILTLRQSEHGTQGLWRDAPTVKNALGAPAAKFFRDLNSEIENYQIRVGGGVTHPLYPGMPVRLSLWRGDEVLGTVMARAPAVESHEKGRENEFQFAIKIPLRPHQVKGPFWIGFTDIPDAPRALLHLDSFGRVDAPFVPDTDPPQMPETATVIGNVDGRSKEIIDGWALCPEEPNCPVELVLYRNGEPVNYSKSRYYRKDVQALHNNAGFNGFRFELPANMSILQADQLEIRALGAGQPLRKSIFKTQIPAGFIEPATQSAPRTYRVKSYKAKAARISVIVLNRNGAELLQDMFTSCPIEDLEEDIEWIVVDHDSKDSSRDVCRMFVDQGAKIRFLQRKGNYSFSESNNFGAEHASGDILLFANNDLIFKERIGDRIRRYMADPGIGALGVRLLDHVDHPKNQDLQINQHIGVFFESLTTREGWVRPYEARNGSETDASETATRCIAVTGAFLALRRDDFQAIDGFDEQYSYGLEDVDLCLKVQTALGLDVVCANDFEIVHHRGFSRNRDTQSGIRRRRNNQIFSRRWGGTLRRMFKETALADPGHVTGARPVFAFMVVDVGDDTSAGEFYTSLEMGRALQKLIPCHVRYIPETEWYDLAGVDVVVSMVNRFDINKVKRASPWLITVNWMRQWFDRWAEDASIFGYDHLFASSETASRFLRDKLELPVNTLPIASSYHAFVDAEPKEEWRCDYSFTGSRFGPPREIEFQLDPDSVEGTGKIFGYNWEGTTFEPLSQGPVSYSKIPNVYASTRIVLDDANVATKPWGSCNSRVFDTMASGALLITNGVLGVTELFGDLVPTFHDAESLTKTLNYWLTHEEEREERVQQMQQVIREQHTYDARARALLDQLTRQAPIRISIKCAAIYSQRQQWGDYHYALSLAAALRRQGFVARVDCRESWYGGLSESDDVTITLRGLVQYKPLLHQTNLLWLISHPNAITLEETETFDHVFVASAYHTENLRQVASGKVDFMPQCTDANLFFFDPEEINTDPNCNLYVANSRGVFRDPVKWAIRNELDIDLYGVGWEPFINDKRFKGGVIPNTILGGTYAASRVVICDHWEDMKNLGYVSNRVFDVLGAGGRLVVDDVRGLDDLVPEHYVDKFTNEEEFAAIINGPERLDLDQRREAAEWVAREHSFDARAKTFAAKIREFLQPDAYDEADAGVSGN